MNNSRHTFASKLLGSDIDSEYRKLSSFSDTEQHKPSRQKASAPDGQQPFNWGQIPSGVKVVRSTCFSCNTACEVLVFVDEVTGKVLKVEGDPEHVPWCYFGHGHSGHDRHGQRVGGQSDGDTQKVEQIQGRGSPADPL